MSMSNKFFLKIIFPAMVTMVLFIAAIFYIIIPSFRGAMMMEKREMIKELSETAWSILDEAYQQQKKGDLTKNEAKEKAIAGINGLRYGNDMKDYFWICDMTPKMVVHPYRPELNGTDLSNFSDANNKKVFVEFVDVIKEHQEGYVEYYWQWKDDPDRIVPKLSYVKEFEPWGWIIGTGIYLDDVEKEIGSISHRVVIISLQIAIVSLLLMFVVIYQSHCLEKERIKTRIALHEAKEKYQALVESSSEAFILILDNQLNYTNRAALKILKYSEQKFLTLSIADIFAPSRADDYLKLQELLDEEAENAQLDTLLFRRDKTTVPVILSISRVLLQNRKGYIIIVREVSAEQMNSQLARQRKLAEDQKELIIDLQNRHRLAGSSSAEWQKIKELSSVDEIIKVSKGFPVKLKSLINSGVNVENLIDMTAKMVDALTIRFIELAIDELGAPPAPFSFIVFGSQGRSEQTMKTDQDNGIIFDSSATGDELEELRSYFLSLGTIVCDHLYKSGYPYCDDNNMAKDPKCVMSLDEWKSCFGDWIFNATPQNILRINIYFDFRSLFGEVALVDKLWLSIGSTIDERPEFLLYFVEDALLYKPPITLFGNIAFKDKEKTISMKEVVSAIVQFARIYALKHHIKQTNTIERLLELQNQKFLKQHTCREVTEVYKILMRLRFRLQAEAMDHGDLLTNNIDPKKMTDIERKVLKQAFSDISSFLSKISYDFKGII